jgi:hypothetical protein
MAYISKRKVGNGIYYYLVEGKRVDGKVKQKVLAYIGDKDKLRKLYENIGEKLDI